MGIDWGKVRVGVAVSDDYGILATPLCTLQRERKLSDRVRRLERLAQQHDVHAIVVGLPLRPDGGEGPEAEAARALGERLAERTGLPVHFDDERFTSAEADAAMRRMGADVARRKQLVDQVAATLILQGFLDRQPPRKS